MFKKQTTKFLLIFEFQARSKKGVPSVDKNVPDSSIPLYMCKLAKKGHKRAVSDTAVLLQKELYQIVEPSSLTQELEEDRKVPNQYPAPDSDDQSWFDYIWSGKFSSHQTTLEKDNAHILLAETLIYCKHQPRKSPVKVNPAFPDLVSGDSEIKVTSAEHILLTLLSSFENPHALKAHEALQLLKVRGDPLAQSFNENGDTTDQSSQQIKFKSATTWTPPDNSLILKMPPKQK